MALQNTWLAQSRFSISVKYCLTLYWMISICWFSTRRSDVTFTFVCVTKKIYLCYRLLVSLNDTIAFYSIESQILEVCNEEKLHMLIDARGLNWGNLLSFALLSSKICFFTTLAGAGSTRIKSRLVELKLGLLQPVLSCILVDKKVLFVVQNLFLISESGFP